ncbi:hypothetical protein HX882_22945 [Pseudomonas gingeri]|uniref:Uncharacterized protein n=1 Tax=Pseudomonas gingeri TaxID=117681 RepID=A0A7Y7XFN4_9PSED|nr:hypothetical protein [Pseudomonas gingeri]NWB98755.1 hypothetical protein [Pseudomonas gingeri]
MTQYSIGLTDGPACEAGAFIVQIIGNAHPRSQRLVICDARDGQPDLALTERKRVQPLDKSWCSSVLHAWDWQAGRRLMLEIDSHDGPPIRLPLLDEMQITPRQMEAQWNQIVPVLPFVPLPGVNSQHDHGTPVLCRAGFIYVFYRQRLWRELQVDVDEQGPCFRDIDVARYRQGEGFRTGHRIASGHALEDIWLPASWNNQRVTDLQLCFSEIQLSAPRLRRLEQDAALRQQRCQSPALYCTHDEFRHLFNNRPDGQAMLEAFSAFDAFDATNQRAAGAAHTSWLNLRQQAFPVRVAPWQRARQPGYEWQFDQPARYLCDPQARYPARCLEQARNEVEGGTPSDSPGTVESGAWAHCLERLVEPEDSASDPLWQAQAPGVDVLQRARARQLCGVLLEDPYYRLRHLQTRLLDQQRLLHLCGAQASQQAHHPSALLIQQLIVPGEIGGKKNPLQHSLDALGERGKGEINRLTAARERARIWRRLDLGQTLLSDSLQQSSVQQAVADHLSLEHFEYAAALHFVSRLFAVLATHPAQLDTLAVNGDITDAVTGVSLVSSGASAGQRFIGALATDKRHPLHPMLWPDLDQQDLSRPYPTPLVATPNLGDGHWRATELAKMEQLEAPNAEKQTQLDAILLAGLLGNGGLNSTLTVQLKAAAATLINLYENLQGAVDTAYKATQEARLVLSDTPQPFPDPLLLRLNRQGVAQLRSLMPETFGELFIIERRDFKVESHYLFGLRDLSREPERPLRHYGEFLGEHGRPIKPSPLKQGQVRNGAQLVVMPFHHPTARRISELNRHIDAVHRQDQQQHAAQQQQARAQGALQETLNRFEAQKNSTVYRALDSVPFTAAVLMLELWNVRNEFDAWDQTEREKGELRAHTSVVAAWADLVIAMEALTVRLAGSQSILASARRTLLTLPEATISWLFGQTLAKRVNRNISARLIIQSGAGLLFVGLNLYDAWYTYQWGDNAYWGYLTMASGGLASVIGGLTLGGPTFLGLGPAGWTALILILAGAGSAYLLSSTPLEDWLKRGPFGPDASHLSAHLQAPKQAFYYLVSLFADLRIAIECNPYHEADPKISFLDDDKLAYSVREANLRVRIESNLPGLLASFGHLSLKVDYRLQETRYYNDGEHIHQQSSYTQAPRRLLAHRLLPEALELYLDSPYSQTLDPTRAGSATYYTWLVRAQVSLNDGDDTWVFPAPLPRDPTPFGPQHSKPDFDKLEQPFWADQTTHKARQEP